MRGVKFHVPAILLIVVTCALLFCGGCSWTPEEKAAQPVPPTQATIPPELRACLDTYAGQYSAEGPLASHPKATRIVTLVLRRDWKATLTTGYQGTTHVPTVEAGTWRCDRDCVCVLLTEFNGQPQRNELHFELREGELVAKRFDAKRYGEGLKLKRR